MRPMMMRGPAALAVLAFAAACAARPPVAAPGDPPDAPAASLQLAGQFSIPPLTHFPPDSGPRFGGLSGLTSTGNPGEFFVVSDDRTDNRVYRMRISGEGASFHTQALNIIPFDQGGDAPRLDPEAIVVTPGGELLVASEGRGTAAARLPPAIVQYTSAGRYVQQLAVPQRYLPQAAGEAPRGTRANAGFESLTITPSGDRLFTATETALLQDGDPSTFESGTTARLLEFRRRGDTFVPAREFAYPLDAVDPAPFTPGASVAGVVDLLALSDAELVSLERTFIEASGQGRGVNVIRLFRISLSGADDISAIDSLKGAGRVRPVGKTLLLDLSGLAGLPAALNTLDNFEGLAFGPPLADGSRSLLLVSDDNFNASQRSWFLLLRFTGR
jgi:hypothetical protein